jgi:3'-phosphoadenosine 5'-phosphosulfate sulfotransferase (PAPS reductase)/FAD synthetase
VGHTAQDVGYRSEEVVGEIRRGRIAMKMEVWRLRQLQSLSLNAKVARTERKIREWYNHWQGDVYVAFSGGLDSTVLLDIVRNLYPDVPAVFCDTGLEYPEIRDFVKSVDNVIWLKPKLTFKETLEKYGYPVISKRVAHMLYQLRNTKSEGLRNLRLTGLHPRSGKTHPAGKVPNKWMFLREAPFDVSATCCDVMKKRPSLKYEKETGRKVMTGRMCDESFQRQQKWMQQGGCNAFGGKRPHSDPMSHWLTGESKEYVVSQGIPYSPLYDMGFDGSGCMFCMFGIQLEAEPNRFQRMKKIHPAQWRYCMDKLGCRQVLEYIGVPYE